MKSTILFILWDLNIILGGFYFKDFLHTLWSFFSQCDTHGHFFFGGPASSCKWGKQIVLGANGGHFILLGSHKNPRPKSKLLNISMMVFYFSSEHKCERDEKGAVFWLHTVSP